MAFNSNEKYTSGKYYALNPGWNEEDSKWKAEIIHRLLQKNNIHPESIIEVGCGAGGILQQLSILNPGIKELEGYDISADAISLALKKETASLKFYNENFTSRPHVLKDVLLCIDVIEHIDDMYGFLGKIKDAAKQIVFHIPLDLSCRTILKPHVILQQREDAGHIHYFSKETAEWALLDCGFQVIDWEYTKPVIDWKPASGLKSKVKKSLRNFSFSMNKDLSAKLWGGYSMMILAH